MSICIEVKIMVLGVRFLVDHSIRCTCIFENIKTNIISILFLIWISCTRDITSIVMINILLTWFLFRWYFFSGEFTPEKVMAGMAQRLWWWTTQTMLKTKIYLHTCILCLRPYRLIKNCLGQFCLYKLKLSFKTLLLKRSVWLCNWKY